MYLTKEIFTGNFYWVTESNVRKYFAIANCTGEGIPVTIVSVL